MSINTQERRFKDAILTAIIFLNEGRPGSALEYLSDFYEEEFGE